MAVCPPRVSRDGAATCVSCFTCVRDLFILHTRGVEIQTVLLSPLVESVAQRLSRGQPVTSRQVQMASGCDDFCALAPTVATCIRDFPPGVNEAGTGWLSRYRIQKLAMCSLHLDASKIAVSQSPQDAARCIRHAVARI